MDQQEEEPVETRRVARNITVTEAAVYSYSPSATSRPTIVEGGRILVPPDLHPSGFFDPHQPDQPPQILLKRVLVERPEPPADEGAMARLWRRVNEIMADSAGEVFELLKPIGYHDRERDQVVLVPADLQTFQTDLTSVPRLFTWLVPRTGVHLPAALLHDGLVHDPLEPRSYIADTEISRAESDRIFRDGMRDLGASWLRRWLVWATVMLATLVSGEGKVRWRISAAVTFSVILAMGTLATIDLFDCREVLPWMGSRPWWVETLTGAGAAVVVSAGLSLLWWPVDRVGRLLSYAALVAGALVAWFVLSDDLRLVVLGGLMVLIGAASLRVDNGRVALMVGFALSLLYHVTLAVVLVSGVFTVAESVFDRRWSRAALAGGATLLLAGVLVLIGVLAC